jgi:hypothetical protein
LEALMKYLPVLIVVLFAFATIAQIAQLVLIREQRKLVKRMLDVDDRLIEQLHEELSAADRENRQLMYELENTEEVLKTLQAAANDPCH